MRFDPVSIVRLSLVLLALCGAASPQVVTAAESAASPSGVDAPAQPVYRVGRGDELGFRFLYAPELNTVATVRPDGRLGLPLAGEFAVEGLTVDELTTKVEALISAQVLRPQLVVNVQHIVGQRIFVGGEVGRPGVQPLVGPLTALQAVMVAEGMKDTAQPRDAVVLRRGPGGESQLLPVDIAGLLNGAAGARDIELRAYDVVIVPRSGVASLDLWIDQYIRKVLPVSLGVSYTINRNGLVQ